VSSTDGITDSAFTLHGTSAASNHFVDIKEDTALIGATISASDGSWSYGAVTPSEGAHSYQAIDDSDGLSANTFDVFYDVTAPRLSSIALSSPATSPTNANSVSFLATFDASVGGVNGGVYNVDTADFTASGTGTLAGLTVSSVSEVGGNPRTWLVTVDQGGSAITGDGTLTLSLSAGATINDLAGNALLNLNPTGTNSSYTIDNTPPSTPTDNNGAANTVVEGAAAGVSVGVTALSTDTPASAITYSLTVDASGLFAIDPTDSLSVYLVLSSP
jgi:hypothetical protein